MDAIDKIGMALTPGTPFNQQNKVFRSANALAQFAGEGIDQGDVLSLVAEHLAERVTIRPSAKHPERGPLIALTEFIPQQQEEAVMVKIVAGTAVEEAAEAGVDVATPEGILAAVKNITGELDEDDVPEDEAIIAQEEVVAE